MYDLERFGIINTGNPKHADVFLITGAVNEQNIPVVRQIYDQMPSPKIVVAIGVCASSGGIFKECYNIIGGVDKVLPVDVYVPGCAARPEAIIDGVVKGLGILAEKQVALRRGIVSEDVPGAYIYEGPHDETGTLLTENGAAGGGDIDDIEKEAEKADE
jgi:ech hydrogenase subunit C